MAEAAAEEKQAVPVAAPPLPIKLIIVVAVVALVMGIGGAVVAVKLLGGASKSGGSSAEHETEDGKSGETSKPGSLAAPGVMVDLEPFIVNLADAPEIRYLKIVIKLEADNETVANDLKARVAQVRDTILVLLTSKDVNSVRTAQGKFQLREEITQRVNGLLPRPGVRGAYFTEFVVQ